MKLTDLEKSAIKTELLTFVERQSKAKAALASKPRTFFSFAKFLVRPAPIIIIVLLLVSTGTSFAASSALPGDLLYPVKIHINENVQSWLAFTPTAQAQVQARLAANRLKEAEVLAAEGKLDAETSQMLQDNFALHSQDFKDNVNELKVNDVAAAADVSSDFETSLEAHGQILNKLSQDNERVFSAVAPLIANIKMNSSSTTQTREQLELNISENSQRAAQSDVQEKMYESQNALNEAIKLFNSSQVNLNATTTAQVQNYLNQTQMMIQNGIVQLGNGALGTAYINFANALRISQQIKILLSAFKEFAPALTAPTSTEGGTEDGSWIQIQINGSSTLQTNPTSSDFGERNKNQESNILETRIRVKQNHIEELPVDVNVSN